MAAEGHIEAVLIHAPDRLSRKYAYQVLLAEEFAKHGVELRFVKSPSVATPEDQLLVQFQGMIAEYERAQILERSRRGKRHRAQEGSISVLSGAPYGYRYMKKSDSTAAYYEVMEAEADVVRLVFQTYIEQASQHQCDHANAQRAPNPDTQRNREVGTIDGVGNAAQSGLCRTSVLR